VRFFQYLDVLYATGISFMANSLYLSVLTAAIGVGVAIGVGMNRKKYEEALSTHVKE
jgi:hypothetical protein